MLVLTYSSINTFRNCHKRYYYAYDQCWKPKKDPWPFIDGSAVHLALEWYYDPKFKDALPEESRNNYIIEEVVKDYDRRTEYEEHDREFHKNLFISLFKGYTIAYPPNEFEEYIPEVKFSFEIENTDLPEKKFILAGKTDAKIKQNGSPYLFETKTTSAYSIKDFLARLRLDNQPDTYLYGFNTMGFGAVGMLYNVLHKPNLRQNNFESDDRFFKRIQKECIDDAHRIPEKRKHYFRETIYRSPHDLNVFQEELLQLSDDMAKYYPYKNPARCADYGGCGFLRVCEGSDILEELFTRKERQHTELEGV